MTDKSTFLLYNKRSKNKPIFGLFAMVPKYIYKISLAKEEITLYSHSIYINNLLDFLKNNSLTRYRQCMDICAVDNLGRNSVNQNMRFLVVYNLSSIEYNTRIRVCCFTNEISPVPSIVNIFPSAGWWEREVWDMFGIYFSDHPDLRRILTDYGFEGHPLRKDFPCCGYSEVRYDDSEKRVVSEPIEMSQELRYFEFSSPWL